MTKPVLTNYDGREPMMRWINEHPQLGSGPREAALSVQNLDGVIHQYLVFDRDGNNLHRNHIMLLETKSRMAKPGSCQQDTFRKLNRLLIEAPDVVVDSMFDRRGAEQVFYHGMHLLQLSQTTPDDSDTMYWDYKAITTEQLLLLLRFELDANTLQPREDRRSELGAR